MRQQQRARRRVARSLAIGVAVVIGLATGTPAGAAQTSPWQTYPATGAVSSGGAANGVVLVGDSLIVFPTGPGTIANKIRTVTGYATYANAAAGAQWVTYGWPGEQNGNALMWDYADLFDVRLTIAALATNDALIISHHPTSYSQGIQYSIMENAVTLTRQHSDCVLLVNMRKRTGVPGLTYTSTQQVNDNMAWLAASFPGGGVHLADWHTHSLSHGDWFISGDVHLTPAGTTAYNAFIAAEADRLIDQEGC